MMLRHPRWIPPARRHSHTSPRSCPQSAGNSCHVVLAATTAVRRDEASVRLTSYSTWPWSPLDHAFDHGQTEAGTPPIRCVEGASIDTGPRRAKLMLAAANRRVERDAADAGTAPEHLRGRGGRGR